MTSKRQTKKKTPDEFKCPASSVPYSYDSDNSYLKICFGSVTKERVKSCKGSVTGGEKSEVLTVKKNYVLPKVAWDYNGTCRIAKLKIF